MSNGHDQKGHTQTIPRGIALLNDPQLNKGTAFSASERAAFGLRGLLPPRVFSMEQQVQRVLENYRNKSSDLERYIHLVSLQDRNQTLFYRVVLEHIEEMLPIIYTPTVGLACQRFGHIFRRAHGLYVSIEDRGHIAELLVNVPSPDVRAIVMTDGERTLGLGDQGVGGMCIPIGKLSLYTVCGGIDPAQCLPVMLDVGTENEASLGDPLYLGLRRRRVRGAEYDAFVAEFIEAARTRWPDVLLQFEDFGNANAFRLLQRWRDEICTFNDDIQGTASVTLAGLLSALRETHGALADQKFLFLGAGEASVGIADLLAAAVADEGLSLPEARGRCWLVDSKGLVVKSRTDLAAHKLRYAHDVAGAPDLISAIRLIRPTALIGASTVRGAFSQQAIALMTELNERPIIFALSNPTSQSECTAEEAYTWSRGRALFASGSPFPACSYEGQLRVPGQCNNVYIFPAVALGVIASGARRVTDRMFLRAARALAMRVGVRDLELGRLFPPLAEIRDISAHVAAAVAEVAFSDGLASVERPDDVLALIQALMWEPRYPDYLAETGA